MINERARERVTPARCRDRFVQPHRAASARAQKGSPSSRARAGGAPPAAEASPLVAASIEACAALSSFSHFTASSRPSRKSATDSSETRILFLEFRNDLVEPLQRFLEFARGVSCHVIPSLRRVPTTFRERRAPRSATRSEPLAGSLTIVSVQRDDGIAFLQNRFRVTAEQPRLQAATSVPCTLQNRARGRSQSAARSRRSSPLPAHDADSQPTVGFAPSWSSRRARSAKRSDGSKRRKRCSSSAKRSRRRCTKRPVSLVEARADAASSR